MERPAERHLVPSLWRCPRCNFVFEPEPTTIRCPRCGENLRKCVYCKFADTVLWECTNARIRFTYGDETGRFRIPEPDHYWPCPENYPVLRPYPWQVLMMNPLLRGLTIGAGVAIGILIIFWSIVLPMIQPPAAMESPLISARVSVSREVSIGQPVRILITLTNSERQPLSPCLVVLSGSLVANASLTQVIPPPLHYRRVGQVLRVQFRGLGAGEQTIYWIYLTPKAKRPTDYTLTVSVYCGVYRAAQPQRSFRVRLR